MYVKKIVLKNFKSFSTATVLLDSGFVSFVGPNGSGKCVRGDSEVLLGDGSVVSAAELVESKLADAKEKIPMDDGEFCFNPEGVEVFSLNPQTLKMERKRIQAFVKRTSPSELCEVETRSGKKIVSTTYHPVITLKEGEVAALNAEELKPGMFIATPRQINIVGEKFYPRLELLKLNLPIYFTDSESKLKIVLTELKAKRGLSWKNLAENSGVPFQILNSFVCGQAIKLFFAARLASYAGLNDFEKTVLFSRVKAKNQRKNVSIPVELDERLARFLGLVISEGRIIKNEIFFYNDAPEIRGEFTRLAKELFDCEAVECLSHGKPFLILSSAPLILLFEHLFQQKPFTHSSDKTVPKQLITASDKVIAAFVSSLFDGDGSVSDPTASKVCLEYASASKQLAKQLAYLFLRLGVVARFSSAEKFASNTVAKTRREYYRVCVYGLENIFALQSKLSFTQNEKSSRFRIDN